MKKRSNRKERFLMKKALSVLLAILMLVSVAAVAAVPAGALNVGKIIEFGTYPQTRVSETVPLAVAANKATWKSYEYYIGTGSEDGNMAPGNHMKFADFFSNGKKYRAVEFTEYRPYGTDLAAGASASY